ncbi:MAG: 2-dehydropantoate 2-reductase [Thermoplasmata archaeon]|nr:2-dehydropantoate 2-reductase [Thermoplasmata archaeon]
MRILVFGAGALGSFVGGMLSQKNDVVLIGRGQHVDIVNKNGLTITGKTEIVVHPIAQESVDGNEKPDWVLVATKSYDTEDAMRTLSPLFKDAAFLSLQNGLGNEDIMSRYVPRVLGGTTSHGITKDGAGRIVHAGLGWTVLGNYQGAEDSVSVIADALNGSGIETEITNDIRREIWKKAIVNAGINPLTAITGQKNGFILENPNLEMTLEAICEEAVQVANAHGIDISVEESIEQTKEVARLTSDNKSSMLQDIEGGKRTEIDSICGAIVKLGMEKNVPTPVNSSLMAVVKGIEASQE